jgi:uncharacterized membrane protein YwzB
MNSWMISQLQQTGKSGKFTQPQHLMTLVRITLAVEVYSFGLLNKMQ